MAQVRVNYQTYTVPAGTLLSDLLPETPHPCGGKGVCGKCKVRVQGAVSPISPAEQRCLTALEVADGIRLACQTTVQGDCQVEYWDTAPLAVCLEGEKSPLSINPGFAHYGVAVDVGTTTLAARLYAADGALLAELGTPNPQAAFGADVISRVEAVLNGKGEEVTAAIRTGLCRLLQEITAKAGLLPSDLDGLVITGNTVMLTLLTGKDVTPFATAPFSGHARFGVAVSADSMGLDIRPSTHVYLPPCTSAFIGGDTITALMAVDLKEKELLVDIGTNGEMVLYVDGMLYACSTAAGPAFEGVGISCGMVAAPGAIDRVELVNGTLHPHVIGGGEAIGICGSGLIDLVACLALLGDPDGPVTLAPGVTLTTEDMQALLVSKSAIRSGVDTLLHAAGLTEKELTGIVVAGGFGSCLNLSSAIRLGLLPSVSVDKFRVVGNAALTGATHLLLDDTQKETAQQLAGAIRVVDLAANPYFAQRFIVNMTLEVAQ